MAKSNKGSNQPKTVQAPPVQATASKAQAKNEPVKKPVSKPAGKLVIPKGVYQFGKMNFIIMFVGFAVLGIGFALMAGGATKDPNIFPADEIYSFRRITLAPAVIIAGFIIELIAIFYKEKSNSQAE